MKWVVQTPDISDDFVTEFIGRRVGVLIDGIRIGVCGVHIAAFEGYFAIFTGENR